MIGGCRDDVAQRNRPARGAALKAALHKTVGKTVGKALAVLSLGLLSACSSSNSGEQAQIWEQIWAATQLSVSQIGATPPSAPDLTRAMLEGVDQPLIRITNPGLGTTATLIAVDRQGAGSRELITWRGVDPVTFTTRAGLLVATKGAGGDLLSSDLRGLERAFAAQGGSYERSLVVMVGNTEGVPLAFRCALQAAGTETLTIVERQIATTRFTETCTGRTGSFRNDYWRGARDDTLWQSRQWAGPRAGHLLIERIIR